MFLTRHIARGTFTASLLGLLQAQSKCEGRAEMGLDGAVGNTPLVHLRTLSLATGCQIFAKCEFMNPTGSVKGMCVASVCGSTFEAY